MEIMKVISAKQKHLNNCPIPTIAFLGDSVTQGCFDIYERSEGGIETIFNKDFAYHNYVAKIFNVLFPSVPINIINAGISGDNARHGFSRLERDVLRHNPDLTVVCYGLNDCENGDQGIAPYREALISTFRALKDAGSEVIFMTANMMNTHISCHTRVPIFVEIAKMTMERQNNGMLEKYFSAGKDAAKECGVKVCDVYAKWKLMADNGVDTTELLANYINHPSEKLNWLFAYSLVETMMS